jgi:hypothetical protein
MFLSRLLEEVSTFRGWKHHKRLPSPRHQNDPVHSMLSVTIKSVLYPLLKVKSRGHFLSFSLCTHISDCIPKNGFYVDHTMGRSPMETSLIVIIKQVSSWLSLIINLFHHFYPNLSKSVHDSPDQTDERIKI